MATNRPRDRGHGLHTKDSVRAPVVHQTIYQKFYHNYKINIGLFHGITRWDVFFWFVAPITVVLTASLLTFILLSSSLCADMKLRWWPRDHAMIKDYGSFPTIEQANIVLADMQLVETELCMIWTINNEQLEILKNTNWTVPNPRAIPPIEILTPTPGALDELRDRKLAINDMLDTYCDSRENHFLQPVRTGGQRFFHRLALLKPSITHTLNMAHIRSRLLFWISPSPDEQAQNASCKLWTETTRESLRASDAVIATHQSATHLQNLIRLDMATHTNVFHRAEYHNTRDMNSSAPSTLRDLSHDRSRAAITSMARLQTKQHDKISSILHSLRRLFDRWWFVAWAAGVQLEGRECASFRVFKGTWEWLDQKFYADEAVGGGSGLERGPLRRLVSVFGSDFAQSKVVDMAFEGMDAEGWVSGGESKKDADE